MINLFILIFFNSAFATNANDCQNRILAYIEYEDKIEGVIVDKKSVFIPEVWSASSEFDGLIVKKEDPAETLTIMIKKTPDSPILKYEEKSFELWSLDNTYKKALVVPKDLLNEHKGTYVLQLKKGAEVLCESNFNAVTED